jgi:hypothetical protein
VLNACWHVNSKYRSERIVKVLGFDPDGGASRGDWVPRVAWPSLKALTEKRLLPPYLPLTVIRYTLPPERGPYDSCLLIGDECLGGSIDSVALITAGKNFLDFQ